MSKADFNGSPRVKGASIFDTVLFSKDAYCEAFSAAAQPRAHWQPILGALDAKGPGVLAEHHQRAERMRHEDGATINPFDDTTKRAGSWALDMIPLPIAEGEWTEIEAGLIQRACLLEKVLMDIYGPQELLRNGSIPAELVFANPNFLHSCHGIQPSGNRFLTFYAADLYRGADGRFRVLRDYGSHPAGLGYALENRIVHVTGLFRAVSQNPDSSPGPFFPDLSSCLDSAGKPAQGRPRYCVFFPWPGQPYLF